MNTNVVIVITAVAAIVLENIVKLAWKKIVRPLCVKMVNKYHQKNHVNKVNKQQLTRIESKIGTIMGWMSSDYKEYVQDMGNLGSDIHMIIDKLDRLEKAIENQYESKEPYTGS